MAHPVFWIAALIAGGWTLKQGKGLLDEANDTTKLALAAGGAYVSWRALKASGVLK